MEDWRGEINENRIYCQPDEDDVEDLSSETDDGEITEMVASISRKVNILYTENLT